MGFAPIGYRSRVSLSSIGYGDSIGNLSILSAGGEVTHHRISVQTPYPREGKGRRDQGKKGRVGSRTKAHRKLCL
jgi:hypothetical protein